MEAGITLTYWQSAIAFATGPAPRAMGSAHPLSAPYQAVECADGYINIAAHAAHLWEQMCPLIGTTELFRPHPFVPNGVRWPPSIDQKSTAYGQCGSVPGH